MLEFDGLFKKKQTKKPQEIKASQSPPGSSEESIHSVSFVLVLFFCIIWPW